MPFPPTDIKILSAIYRRYYDTYAKFEKGGKDRRTKIYVPIDIAVVAADLRVDDDIVFGRLHYDLNRRYGYTHDDGSRVEFFALSIGGDMHCVNFPYLASVLAEQRDRHEKFWIATLLALISVGIALLSLVVSLFAYAPAVVAR